jgi:hypothetical protein
MHLHLHNCRGLGVLASPPLCPTAVPAVLRLKKLIDPRLSTPRGGLAQSTLPQQHRQMDCGGECKPACCTHSLLGGMGTRRDHEHLTMLLADVLIHYFSRHALCAMCHCHTCCTVLPVVRPLSVVCPTAQQACRLHGHPTAYVCLHLPFT